MSTNLNKISIPQRSPAYPSKKIRGLGRDGKVTDNLDFFNESIKEDWWNFFTDASIPSYNEEESSFSIGIRSDKTCTGTDSELEATKQEYLFKGIQALFDFYGKDYNSDIISDFASGLDGETETQISSVIDYHLSPRPASKLKFLIEVSAEYLNALPDKPLPASFTENLNDSGDLIVEKGLLNPTLDPTTGVFKGYDNISIVTLNGLAYHEEIVKTSLFMIHMNRDMQIANFGINGINLYKEAERLKGVASKIGSFVGFNFSVDGFSNGKSLDFISGQVPVIFQENVPYKIHLAFKENEQGLYEILWASLKSDDNNGDIFLNVGFEDFINSDPLDNQTTLRYLFFHQQVLNNLDKKIELNFVDFIEAYHYPKIKLNDMVSQKIKEVPFQTNFDETLSLKESSSIPYSLKTSDQLADVRPIKRCGLSWPGDLPNFDFDILGQLQQLLEPLNYNMELKLTFFNIGPPCPVPVTGDTIPGLLKSSGVRLKERASSIGKNIERIGKKAEEEFEYVGDYFTSEEYLKDLEKRFGSNGSLFMKMRQLGDMVLNEFGLDKMLKLVCICITQLGDELLEQNGIELSYPNTNITLKGPGFAFDPSLLSADADDDFNVSQALSATWGEFQYPNTDVPFQLEQLCSFCIDLPFIIPKLPTFDLLAEFIDLLLALLESLIVNILMQLILSLIRWLQRCPDFQCEVRPRGGALDDFGSIPIDGFFPDDSLEDPNVTSPRQPPVLEKCIALNGIQNAVEPTELADIQKLLLQRISAELSSGEMLNLFEGYPTTTVLFVIKEIIDTEQGFAPIRPFLNSVSKVQDFCDCLVDNLDPNKIKNLDFTVRDPDYCPSPENNPANYLKNKCDNEEQVKRFLINERSSKAAKLNGIISNLRDNNNFFQEMIPELFSSIDPETNQKKAGLLSDEKFRPAFLDTVIEQYNRFMEEINTTARREGKYFLNSLYQDGSPNSGIANDKDLETHSTLSLTAALTVALSAPLFPPSLIIAEALAPYSSTAARTIDTKYPIVGGAKLKASLESIESNSSILIQSEQPLMGSSATFSGITIEDKSTRQFNSGIRLKNSDGEEVVSMYFESLTDTLKLAEENNVYSNHFVLRVKSPEVFGTNNYISFATRAPIGVDIMQPVLTLGIPSIKDVITSENDVLEYSPQGIVFSQLVEKQLSSVFNNILPDYQDKIKSRISSNIHTKAFIDVVHKVGIKSSFSPYFKTYTYEDLENGVGSSGKQTKSFRRFGRYDSYYDVQLGPTPSFKQKYSATDKAGRTKVYWVPTPAIQDTPLRDGRLEDGCLVKYINVDEMKNKIKENWDPMIQYDPNDITSLPPLSVAILDELIPETVKFYCIDSALKTMPVSKMFKDYGLTDLKNEMFATLVTRLVIEEMSSSGESGMLYYYNFIAQVENYWERRYKEDDSLDVADAPKGDAGIQKLVEGFYDEAEEKAAELIKIKHLNEEDIVLHNPLTDIFMHGDFDKGATPNDASVFGSDIDEDQLEAIKTTLESLGLSYDNFASPPPSTTPVMRLPVFPYDSEANGDQIQNVLSLPLSNDSVYHDVYNFSNGFALEGYITVALSTEVQNYVVERFGVNFLDQIINGKHSTRDLKAADFTEGVENASILRHFLHTLAYETNLPPAFSNMTKMVGDENTGIFKNIEYHTRVSFVVTDLNSTEEFINEIFQMNTAFSGLIGTLAGNDDLAFELKRALLKEKSLIFEETVGGEVKKVISLPLITKNWGGGNSSSLFKKDLSEDTVFKLAKDTGINEGKPKNNVELILVAFFAKNDDMFNDFWTNSIFTYDSLYESFKGTTEYEALFGYAFPVSVATKLVSMFSFVNLLSGLQAKNIKSFRSTKELYKMFFLIATNRSDFTGKGTSDMSQLDFKALTPSSSTEVMTPEMTDEEKEKFDKEKAEQNICDEQIGPSSLDVTMEF